MDTLTEPAGIPKRRWGKHRAPVTGLRRLFSSTALRLRSVRRDCRSGHHRYAPETPIGAGILRAACTECGNVSLDLREANLPRGLQLFSGNGERKTFAVLRRQAIPRRWPLDD